MSEETAGDVDLEEGLEQKKTSGKKIVIIVGAVVVLLLAGVGAAFLFMGGDDEDAAQVDETTGEVTTDVVEEAASDEPIELLFFELEPMLVNLNTAGGKASYLKITISLEVDKQSSMDDLQQKLPRIIDNFQVYLRELRVEDLNGSAGMFRLKEELLSRVNDAVYPTRVHDVLFKEILING